jgi:hypothetical protein
MIAQSERFVDPKTGQRVNATGVSDGFNGDGFKLGGGRFDPNFALGDSHQIQPLGGRQGGLRTLFGRPYQAGGFVDRVIESFAGPHDWLGSWWSYDGKGNNAPERSFFGKMLGHFLSTKVADPLMSAVNIPLAAPFVASSWVGTSPYSGVALTPRPTP